MKNLIFDSGPIISFAMNNLFWMLESIQQTYNGHFYITPPVSYEIVEKPMESKKFKLEAVQVKELITKDVLRIVDTPNIREDSNKLLELANHLFKAQGNWMQLVSLAEMSVLAASLHLHSDAVVIDEFTTRMLIEDQKRLHERLEKKLHTAIHVNNDNLHAFTKQTQGINVIRSTEIAFICFEKGLLNRYKNDVSEKDILDSVLWGLKLNGCSITSEEITTLINHAH